MLSLRQIDAFPNARGRAYHHLMAALPGNNTRPPASPPEPEWPEHFPAGCPACETTTPLNGPVFRLVHSPPKPKDIKSWLERGLKSTNSDCIRSSLSSCVSLEDIRELRKTQAQFRDCKIVRGDLTP